MFLVQTHHGSKGAQWRTVRSTTKAHRADKWFTRLVERRVSGGVKVVSTDGQVVNRYLSPDFDGVK